MKYGMADQWLKNRLQMPTRLSSMGLAGIAPAIRAQAFFSAKVAQGHVLSALRKVSDAFTRGDMDLATARLRLKDALGTRYEPGEKEDADLKKLASTARLNLILRQNARMAMAVGEYEQGRDPAMERMFPCWRYIASTSAKPRADHQAFAGKVFRKDDPIWHRIFPPWDFNCKCSVEEVAADELEPGMVEPLTNEDKLPAIAESGFAFDPAEALRVYDPELIHSEELRENTVRELMGMGCIQREDGKLEMPIDNAPEDESERLQRVLFDASDVVKKIPGKIKPSEAEARTNGILLKNRDFYPKKHGIIRDDGVDERAFGLNELKYFSTGPVLDTIVPVIEDEQKLLLDNGILGFRGIIRIPPEEELTDRKKGSWVKTAPANTSAGILGLNEKKLLSLVFEPGTREGKGNVAVWYNFRASDRVKCLVLHEFGHQLFNRLEKISYLKEIYETVKKKYEEQGARKDENERFRYQSCEKNIREWFAENYCAWRMEPSLMDNPELGDIFSKVLKRR